MGRGRGLCFAADDLQFVLHAAGTLAKIFQFSPQRLLALWNGLVCSHFIQRDKGAAQSPHRFVAAGNNPQPITDSRETGLVYHQLPGQIHQLVQPPYVNAQRFDGPITAFHAACAVLRPVILRPGILLYVYGGQ